MRIHELAKVLNFKACDMLTKAKELGLSAKAISSMLSEEEVAILTTAFEGMTPNKPEPKPEKVDLSTISHDLKKGALIGVVFDGNRYQIVTCRMSLDQVKKYEHEVISDHKTVNGALVEINKHLHKKVNANTVKNFKEEK